GRRIPPGRLELELVADVIEAVSGIVDVDVVLDVIVEGVEIGPPVRLEERNPIPDDRDLVRGVGRHECVKIGVVGQTIFGGHRRTRASMTRTLRGWAIQGVALAAALCAAGRPGVAGAHEFWLSPSSYRQTKGDTLEIAAFVGTGFRGERCPYAATRTRSFELLGAKRLDLAPATVNGELVYARFIGADAGGSLAAYESGF